VEDASTMLYTAPLSMTADPIDQKDCPVGKDGYLIPVKNQIDSANIPTVEFDDAIYLKSIQDNLVDTSGHSDVKMQKNPSYQVTNVPYNDSV